MRAILFAVPLAILVGCDQPAKPKPVTTKASASSDGDHDHGAGPHGGTVIEFGKNHAEFCVDHGKKEVTVYILSGNLKRPVALAADKLTLSVKQPKLDVELKPSPLESDPAGKASRFVAVNDAFGKEQEFAGTVHGVIDGTPYSGDFEEKPHDHGHDHK